MPHQVPLPGFHRSTAPVRRRRLTLLAAAGCGGLLTLTAACGSAEPAAQDDPSEEASTSAGAKTDLALGEGAWLIGVTTAEGADAETAATTYISYDPSTGEATAHKVPGVQGGSTDPAAAALLLSADRKWAIPSVDVAPAQGRTGKLVVYPVGQGATKSVDLRALTGQADATPVAWAFDPNRSETVRVVDGKDRVWAVDLATDEATSEGRLPTSEAWIYTNGFDRNSGVPWVESIDSDETRPAGNGISDTRPVEREGGTMIASESPQLQELPKSPCRLAGAYTASDGATWAFCADADALKTYTLAEGAQEWEAYGKPSTPVAPAASAVTVVLPPAE